jgi:hypothetical protein
VSDLSEKLASPAESTGTRARASLTQLRMMWSSELIEEEDRVVRTALGDRQVWRLVDGLGRGSNAVFELQRSTDEG